MRTETMRRAARPLAARLAGAAPDAASGRATASAQERARRRVIGLVFAIYLLAIFEGALRKYVLPQLGQYIFFVRDPFLVWAYVIATRWKLWPRNDAMFRIVVWAAGGGVVLFVLQMAFGLPSDLRLLLGAYGWRAYFLYLPLAFLMGAQFRHDDLMRLARLTLLLAVPIAVLVSAQFFSPPTAMVNVGTAEEKLLQFRDLALDATHIRPAGPFSSNAGMQQFATTAFALLLSLGLMRATQRRISALVLLLGAGSILTCIALSGSRGTILQSAMILLFALPVALLGRDSVVKTRAALVPVVLAVGAVVLYPIVFPEGFAAFVGRWNTAAHDESGIQGGVFGRALIGFVDFLRLVDIVPALGFGLGFGGNAAILLKATIDGVLPGVYAETDYSRHMVDLGPACGMAYIIFRFVFVLWLMRRVLRATRQSASPLPMMLFAYAGYVVLMGQITGNGSINFFAWFVTGLCMAACRVAVAPRAVAPQPARAAAPVRARRARRQPSPLAS